MSCPFISLSSPNPNENVKKNEKKMCVCVACEIQKQNFVGKNPFIVSK